MKKLFLSLSFISTFIYAEIKIQDITSKPSGRAKNFMIWQYLKQDITSKEADTAYSLVEGNIYKIKKLYLKKSKNQKLLKIKKCKKRRDLLDIEDKECFKYAFSLYKTQDLDLDTRKELIKKVHSQTNKDALWIQSEPHSEKDYIAYSENTILNMFIKTNAKYRRDNLDLLLSQKFINYIFSKKASSRKKYQLIKTVLRDEKLKHLRKSIFLISPKNIGSHSNFLLGLAKLEHHQEEQALKHFLEASKTTKRRRDVDKNIFWMYQISKNLKYLTELSKSTDINLYSLYAKEKTNTNFENYFSSLSHTNLKSKQNLSDPFQWEKIKEKIKNTPNEKLLALSQTYNQKNMQVVKSFIMEKVYKYKKHAYLMPYDEYLDSVSIDDKAIIYALMRQESAFIPSALSRSFALGLMQIMPFVADDLSRNMNNPIKNYNDMFKPEYNLKYAIKHLKWLKKTYYHPLFIAYAYNGGLGFLKRHLEQGTFRKDKYEPFLSMEKMKNSESREYGKKVLTNYVVYKIILGEEVSLISLLKNLTNPMKTDRYRSAK